MAYTFDVLPDRTGGAAENMALDFLLLQRHRGDPAVRFRHYDWRRPAFTFGYSQKIGDVRSMLPGESVELCRRPTGGGLVDHREDWTYTLVAPRGHPLEAMRAIESYGAIHEALAAALRRQGVPARLQEPLGPETGGLAGACFARAETADVILGPAGMKIAGAAQKRNRNGLLFQGSVWRPAARPGIDWEQFGEDFVAELETATGSPPVARPFPDLDEEELGALSERYASPEWNEAR